MTPAELLILKNATIAEPALSTHVTSGSDTEIAAWYNAIATPDFLIWNSATPTDDIINVITWSMLIPTGNPDNTVTWGNRAASCNIRQNTICLLLNRDFFDATKTNLRLTITDALTNVPSGTTGALQNAGSVAAIAAMQRKATRLEKLFSIVSGAASITSISGPLSVLDVSKARKIQG